MKKEAIDLHRKIKGKTSIYLKKEINNSKDLSLLYTPGVADVCKLIKEDEKEFENLTGVKSTVAVMTNGTAVLGLGDIGVKASLPVMEGKAALFKAFADIDAVSVLIDEKDSGKFVSIAKSISKTYGAINLEDIAAPNCFKIEKELQNIVDIPVFHDDQHGTAIVVTAAIISSYRYLKKDIGNIRCVISGAGAAGIAIADMLIHMGVKDISILNSKGLISKNNFKGEEQKRLALITNPENRKSNLKDEIIDKNLFIGVSKENLITTEDVKKMNSPIIFALANPNPEILPEEAYKGGAIIVATGRSDYPNQVNNLLAFPGVIKGALLSNAKKITMHMKYKAAIAISNTLIEEEISKDKILPDPFNKDLHENVANSVKEACYEENSL